MWVEDTQKENNSLKYLKAHWDFSDVQIERTFGYTKSILSDLHVGKLSPKEVDLLTPGTLSALAMI